jgi:hypothetical protein
MAQGAFDRAINDSDIRRAEQTRLGAVTSEEAGGWDIEINLPLSWTSNAVQQFGEQADVVGPPKSDWHVTPDALLRYTYQFDWVKLSAKLDVGEDRYFQQITVNQDAVYATLKAEFTDGRSDIFVPYVAYTPEVDFLPFFAHWQASLQDFYGGFTSGIGFKDAKLARYADAIDPGDWSMLFDVRAGQRLAAPSAFENTFFRVSADIIYVVKPELSFWLTGAYRYRHYPDFFGDVRHDSRLSAITRAVWTPDWLTRRIKSAEISFEVAWYKNYSNIASERYTSWELGPSVLLAWHF